MTYRRVNPAFNAQLQQRADELRLLKAATVTVNEGRVTITALPYLQFPNTGCAERFLRRVTRGAK